jgi:glucosamine-6-phosphate deaminase
MAFSENKSAVVRRAVEGDISTEIPATFLQLKGKEKCNMYLDSAAAAQLTRYSAPWVIRGLSNLYQKHYDEFWLQKAVIWLSTEVKKPILCLVESDYEEHGLMDLLFQHGGAEHSVGEVNLKVFKKIKRKINGWPAGHPSEKELR